MDEELCTCWECEGREPPSYRSSIDAEIDAEIEECERLEAIAAQQEERERQLAEQDAAYTEWLTQQKELTSADR